MKKLNTSKLIWILSILLVFSFYLNFKQYKDAKQEENRQLQTFLGHFYFHVSDDLRLIEKLIEERPTDQELKDLIDYLDYKLSITDQMLFDSSYILQGIAYRSIFREMSDLLVGYSFTSVSQSGSNTITVPPMGIDGKLNDHELRILNSMRDILHKVINTIIVPETGTLDPNFKPHYLDDLLIQFHVREIYWDTQEFPNHERKI